MTDTSSPERPGIISLIAILLWLQALVAAITAVILFVNRNNAEFQERLNQDPEALLSTGFVEVAAAVILAVGAMGLMRGSSAGRSLVATIMVARVGIGVYEMMAHSGGLVVVAAVGVAISLFILWALYDHQDSRAYFY